MTPILFDTQAYLAHLERAQKIGVADFLIKHVSTDLEERLGLILRQFNTVADIGSPTPVLSKNYAAYWLKPQDLPQSTEQPLNLQSAHYDLIVSAFALHAVNDLPGMLIQMRRSLRPDGLFMACIPGGQTLHELRSVLQTAESEITGGVSPRVSPFGSIKDFGFLLQRAGFTLPVTDSDILTVRYEDIWALCQDLRSMGATNILTSRLKHPTKKAVFERAAELYQKQFSDGDGRIRATFELIWVSGWAAHESQQKALKPGSAKHKMADFLNPT